MGSVRIHFHDKLVFALDDNKSEPQILDEFPGNATDSQFHETNHDAAAAAATTSNAAKFSCAYTGVHDHGALPAQNRKNVSHEHTLSFLVQARAQAEEFLKSVIKN